MNIGFCYIYRGISVAGLIKSSGNPSVSWTSRVGDERIGGRKEIEGWSKEPIDLMDELRGMAESEIDKRLDE